MFKSVDETGMSEDADDDQPHCASDDGSDELGLKSTHSFVLPTEDDEESLRRTPSSLNNFSILPPIKPTTAGKLDGERQLNVIKHLQEKYHATDGLHGAGDSENEAKLDDAYLKMKRLDKALEEAFEKEKQVKTETMSLMRKIRNEMQSMTVALNVDSNDCSHTQSNLKRFLALDDEILKLDGSVMDDDHLDPTQSIFKTQLNDPLGDSSSTAKSDRESLKSHTKLPSTRKKKKSSISSNSTNDTKDTAKKSQLPDKDFIKRNIELAKESGVTWALTDDEKHRLNELLNEDEPSSTVALPDSLIHGYSASISETQRLREIDELLEREYYNPLLNHQLRRNNCTDIDYGHVQQVPSEEHAFVENHFGERALKETRLQREHTERLKRIDEKLDRLHQPVAEKKIEAILSDEQLNELLGQCAVDEMKQRFSLLNRDQSEQLEIDFNQLSDFTLTHYVENNQGPLMTDEIIQLLINEARQEEIE